MGSDHNARCDRVDERTFRAREAMARAMQESHPLQRAAKLAEFVMTYGKNATERVRMLAALHFIAGTYGVDEIRALERATEAIARELA